MTTTPVATSTIRRTITVAVVGAPNCGKSTLINAMTGARLTVGNWPGVTVSKKVAELEYRGRTIRFVDLPGIYGLGAYSPEEVIARNYLTGGKPDVILNVIDSTNLERNLYLTVQLLELRIPTALALNIYDEAQAKGVTIDKDLVESMLGVAAVHTVSTKKEGLTSLRERICSMADKDDSTPDNIFYGDDIETAIGSISARLKQSLPGLVREYPERWLCLKLMEGDREIVADKTAPGVIRDILGGSLAHLESAHDDDMDTVLADQRHAIASGIARKVSTGRESVKSDITGRIDSVVLNRYLALPIFFAAMWLMFKLTFDVATPFMDWIDALTAGPLKRWAQTGMETVGASDWMVSLAADGVLGGVGFVLVFVPVIASMMFFITLLEGTGYMARAAFIMDRAMSSMGLHGKSFIPMIIGFGCNVPSIYATRTIERERDRALTALLVPLMSCSARLPVYVLFASLFFPGSAGLVLWSMYVLGMALAVVMGIVFKNTIFRGEPPLFIMELPPYRAPSPNNLLVHTWEKVKHFIVKAGTVILAASILVWFLFNLPWGVDNTKGSYLGKAGQVVAPALAPLGFGTWEAGSALIAGVVAKEIIVSTLGEIHSLDREKTHDDTVTPPFSDDVAQIAVSFGSAVKQSVANVFSGFGVASISAGEGVKTDRRRPMVIEGLTPLSALSFMAFTLVYMPCLVTAAAFKSEFGSWKWFFVAAGYELCLAWLVALIIYQGGTLLGFGG